MSKRKSRGAALPEVAEVAAPSMGVRPALAIGALLLVLAVAGGVLLRYGATPPETAHPVSCRTAAQLAPLAYAASPPRCIDPALNYRAVIHTTKGDITAVLDARGAPDTVNNFTVLAGHDFYNGLRFFRVADWVVQGGDPNDNGTGGPGYTLPPEPTPAGTTWVPGSLGMAVLPGGAVNGSQFFITKSAWPGGDPTTPYNHFGTVTLGLDVVGQLSGSDRILRIDVQPA